MTRDEIKNTPEIVGYLIDDIVNADSRNKVLKRLDEICNLALKALEQEPILDKIRAEIQDIAFDWQEIDGEHESFMVVDLNDALNIIDKYKAESENDGKGRSNISVS